MNSPRNCLFSDKSYFFSISKQREGSLCGVLANVLYSDIIMSDFDQ